jgi:peptidoglycan/LPS O-acetylase OafA/YrhL
VGVATALLARRYRRQWLKLWPILLLVVVHPGWWMSARSGDCGHTLRLASVALTFLSVMVAGLLVVLARRSARRPARS